MASHEPEGRTFRNITADTKAVGLCEVVAVRIERISGKSGLAQKKSDEEKKALSTFLKHRDLPGDAETAALIIGKEK